VPEETEELKRLARRLLRVIDSLEDWWSSEAVGIGDELTPAIHEANRSKIDSDLAEVKAEAQRLNASQWQ
jgi:hypothetical protein